MTPQSQPAVATAFAPRTGTLLSAYADISPNREGGGVAVGWVFC